VYLLILGALYYIITFPLNLYETFILERKFSLSNNTYRSWIIDELKRLIISGTIFIIMMEAFYLIARNFPGVWWLACAVFWIIASIIFVKIFPLMIIPLFYKYKELSNPVLKDRAMKLAKKFNIKVLGVFEINLSKDTKKSNAAIVGWGNTKRVILADNLINEFTDDEIEVVVAHEMAHHKLNHIWKLLSIGSLSTIIFFFILNCIVQYAAGLSDTYHPFDIAALPIYLLLYALFNIVVSPIQNSISRKLETDADGMALKITNLKSAFISLMEKLAKANLSDMKPNIVIEFLFYDHPPISKRIESAKRAI
jgi:STE24 endopeptidase